MLSMMLDEMISPTLVPRLWAEGIDTVHVRDRKLLRAEDHVVWRRARSESRTTVTINAGDFRKLAARDARHHGLVIVPNGGTRDMQFDYVMASAEWARANDIMQPSLANHIVVVAENLSVQVDAVQTGSAALRLVSLGKPGGTC